MRRICVFCGAHVGRREAFAESARRMGAALAERGIGLVTGGGRVGLMGVVADAALERGGEVIGVIPSALVEAELAHTGLTELRTVRSMHERKQVMHDLSDGFAVLPGGMGSLDEMFETLTWMQLGYHKKPLGLLNADGYYDPLIAMMDRAAEEGFVRSVFRAAVPQAPTAEALLDLLLAWEPPAAALWSPRSERVPEP